MVHLLRGQKEGEVENATVPAVLQVGRSLPVRFISNYTIFCMLMATSLPGIFPSIKDCNANPVSFQDRFGHAFKPLHKIECGTEGSSRN